MYVLGELKFYLLTTNAFAKRYLNNLYLYIDLLNINSKANTRGFYNILISNLYQKAIYPALNSFARTVSL
jgi:nucleoside-specific outer membrane channel protein Tsx